MLLSFLSGVELAGGTEKLELKKGADFLENLCCGQLIEADVVKTDTTSEVLVLSFVCFSRQVLLHNEPKHENYSYASFFSDFINFAVIT